MKNVVAVIMAGGRGERLWPLSRFGAPKTLLRFLSSETLIESTLRRFGDLIPMERVLIITAADLVSPIQRIFPQLPPENIIGEPIGRNTAPCIALTARIVEKRWGEDSVLFVVGADYWIGKPKVFLRSARAAARLALSEPVVVTLGVVPTYPSTGYGYIQRESEARAVDGVNVYPVKSFREKPDRETAERFCASGEYYWNSGMFVWMAKVVREKVREHIPQLDSTLSGIEGALATPRQKKAIEEVYPDLPSLSIDYGVIEKLDNVLVIPADMDWDDVGSWSVFERRLRHDVHGNVARGNHLSLETEGCIIVSCEENLVATLGVRDLAIIHAGDVVLVADKSREQDVKRLVEICKRDQSLAGYL